MLVVIKISVIFLLFYGISDGFFYGVPAKLEPELAPQVGWYLDRQLIPQVLNLKPWHLSIAVNFASWTQNCQSYSRKNQFANEILAEGTSLRRNEMRLCRTFIAKADCALPTGWLTWESRSRGARLVNLAIMTRPLTCRKLSRSSQPRQPVCIN
jgi:hypothetical protein